MDPKVADFSRDCFRECVGKHVKDVIFDTFPVGYQDLNSGTNTLIFDDGTALTISSMGSYWLESPEEIKRAIQELRARLERTKAEIGRRIATDHPFDCGIDDGRPDGFSPWAAKIAFGTMLIGFLGIAIGAGLLMGAWFR